MKMQTHIPAQKVTVATAAAAIVQLTVGIVETSIKQPIPGTITAPLTTLAVFSSGYFTPPAKRDIVLDSEENQDKK